MLQSVICSNIHNNRVNSSPINIYMSFYFHCFPAIRVYLYEGIDKQSFWVLKCDYFLTDQLKYMFWVLKRTVSIRRFFWVPTTYVLVEKLENCFVIALFNLEMRVNAFSILVQCNLQVYSMQLMTASWVALPLILWQWNYCPAEEIDTLISNHLSYTMDF